MTASFPLQSKLSALAETVIATADTISDIVYGNEGQPPLSGNLAYSQAFQYSVQLTDVNTRKFWQVGGSAPFDPRSCGGRCARTPSVFCARTL